MHKVQVLQRLRILACDFNSFLGKPSCGRPNEEKEREKESQKKKKEIVARQGMAFDGLIDLKYYKSTYNSVSN